MIIERRQYWSYNKPVTIDSHLEYENKKFYIQKILLNKSYPLNHSGKWFDSVLTVIKYINNLLDEYKKLWYTTQL